MYQDDSKWVSLMIAAQNGDINSYARLLCVPAVQWPAMTMAFNATTQQLADLKAGDRVAFEFRAEGMGATFVAIKTLK